MRHTCHSYVPVPTVLVTAMLIMADYIIHTVVRSVGMGRMSHAIQDVHFYKQPPKNT